MRKSVHLATNGGDAGTPGDGISTFDTEQFINALNAENFGGFNDWRMPTLKELKFIADLSKLSPAIDTAYFPNTVSSYHNYWSSTTDAISTGYACIVWFHYGDDHYNGNGKYFSHHVRAVRSGQNRPFDHLVINGEIIR